MYSGTDALSLSRLAKEREMQYIPWIWVALPFLLIAVCPLSMLVMLFSMHRMRSSQKQEQGQGEYMAHQMQQLPAQNEQRVEYVQGPRQVVTDGFPKG